MGIFDKIKTYVNELNAFEDTLIESRKDIQAVYQRNKELEKEIEERTQQLNQVNKTLGTLEDIWNMMNSSTPIADAFNMIVESLQTDFGYLFGAIVEKFDDEKGPNRLGYDIFYFYIDKTNNEIQVKNIANCSMHCRLSQDWSDTCYLWVLKRGNIDYQKRDYYTW